MGTATRKCCGCKSRFPVEGMTKLPAGWFHSMDCAYSYGNKKAKKTKEKDFNAETRKRKEKLKTRSDWLREAQKEFNRYIRLRDNCVCISCQKPLGSKYDAGHYRSVGAHPELRFCEENVHSQCVHCNQHKSGNAIDYRINLINKIGLERVEWLEGAHELQKLNIEQIKEIKQKYKAMANALQAES